MPTSPPQFPSLEQADITAGVCELPDINDQPSTDERRRRWSKLFSTSIGVDLRQAIRDGEGFDPCEDGLRSAFLLYGPLSQVSWPKKLSESRSAYTSLRNHFLRFIEHPNDLHSSADPLADDDTSPWSTLRQDELSREEIFQDVTRCMQDNYFFREPVTQKKLLDILFIYAKLNPDTGYRQGMHELLAPILWVIQQDAIDPAAIPSVDKQAEGVDFMLDVLDDSYIEHDAFSLFCAVMQTAKAFYEVGESKDSSAIVTRSKRIHDEILANTDPELALHLQVVGILPQIYSIRWIRLLFGREFDFKEVLGMWDLFFAENLRPDVVDLTCVAMLLRIRWSLLESDYSGAIITITHYKLPEPFQNPRSLVRDAIALEKSRNEESGADMIQQYTGRRPKRLRDHAAPSNLTPRGLRTAHSPRLRHSPSASPGRFSSPQRQLEGLFQDVTGNLQRRTEGWNISKAVSSAVGEVRRNMNQYQVSHSRTSSTDHFGAALDRKAMADDSARSGADKKLKELQSRNKILAKMLDDSLETLRSTKIVGPEGANRSEEDFNISLAKIQFVSVYLSDPDIPIPRQEPAGRSASKTHESMEDSPAAKSPSLATQALSEESTEKVVPHAESLQSVQTNKSDRASDVAYEVDRKETKRPASRPSLMDSSFSFMLGENRHRSSFVSSASNLPEEKRDESVKNRLKTPPNDSKMQRDHRVSESDDDGFTLTHIQGHNQP